MAEINELLPSLINQGYLMSLCLNMIVKDESHIIEQTLRNICQNFPITHWIISDTGSSDNTIELIKNFFQKEGIDGCIHQEPWKNFSHNRNVALEACKGKGDYVLFFDADDYVEGVLTLPELSKDTYLFQFTSESGEVMYFRKLIIKNNGMYHWRSVLHEFITSETEKTSENIVGDYVIVSGRKGSRNKNKNKYLDDAKILEAAFKAREDEDLLPRYAFYCAQSYRDAQLIEPAILWYQKRIELDAGWKDEIYCSYIELGLLFERKNNHKEALYYWQQGIAHDPLRAECWYHCARRHSWDNNSALAYVFAKQACEIKIPEGSRLFIRKNIYLYWSYYEWCCNAYKEGKIAESYQAFKQLVKHCPPDLISRVSHQVPAYKPLMLQDSFAEVSELPLDLLP